VCPSTFEDGALGEAISLGFQEGTAMPYLSATVDGAQGDFLIDTGDRSTLTVFEDFSRKNAIEDHYKNFVNMITGEGVGGPISANVLRLRSFEFGAEKFTDFPTRFPSKADFSVENFAGNLGNGLLGTRNLIFDFPKKVMIILAQSGLGYRQYDRSGLWLVKGQSSFLVRGIVPKSPAGEAGIEVGDEILDVNGISFEHLFLPKVRRTLSSQILPAVNLRVSSKGLVKNVRIQLRDLF
jgi:hypothetical protein